MSKTTIAHGKDQIVQKAVADASAVQDACNRIAIVGDHPVSIAFTSKLSSLCRMSLARESAAFDAIIQLQRGEDAEFEVIPL